MINTSELTQTISQTAVKKKLPKGVRQWIEVAPFILVGLILVCVFIIYPEIKSIWMSFLDYNVMDESKSVFIGFKNYLRAFVGNDSQYFYLAFRNVLLYALVTIPVGMLLGLIMAVLTNGVKHGQLFFRSMLYLPVLIDWIIVGTIFLYLFQDGQSGLINYYMIKLHILKKPIGWLTGTWTANTVIWILGIYKSVGWTMTIYVAALQGISKDYYEAAEIDGASASDKLWHITVPLLKQTSVYILIQLIIGSFGCFLAVYILTQGGPLGTTDVLQNLMYTQAFSNYYFGYACALSVIIAVSILLLTVLRNKFFQYEKI
jgi:multiple sugar transport system permease protein